MEESVERKNETNKKTIAPFTAHAHLQNFMKTEPNDDAVTIAYQNDFIPDLPWLDVGYENTLYCPLCRASGEESGNYNHAFLVAAEIDSEKHREEAIPRGISLCCVRDNGEPRPAVRIDFRCECGGHYWSLIFQQHKGDIIVSWRKAEKVWQVIEQNVPQLTGEPYEHDDDCH